MLFARVLFSPRCISGEGEGESFTTNGKSHTLLNTIAILSNFDVFRALRRESGEACRKIRRHEDESNRSRRRKTRVAISYPLPLRPISCAKVETRCLAHTPVDLSGKVKRERVFPFRK